MRMMLIACLAAGIYTMGNLYNTINETKAWANSGTMEEPPHPGYLDVMEILHGCMPSVFPRYRECRLRKRLVSRKDMSYDSDFVFVVKDAGGNVNMILTKTDTFEEQGKFCGNDY